MEYQEQEYVTKAPYLTEEDVYEARHLYFIECWLMQEIADYMDVSLATMSNAINAKRYYKRYPLDLRKYLDLRNYR